MNLKHFIMYTTFISTISSHIFSMQLDNIGTDIDDPLFKKEQIILDIEKNIQEKETQISSLLEKPLTTNHKKVITQNFIKTINKLIKKEQEILQSHAQSLDLDTTNLTQDVIDKKFRSLALKSHPDKNDDINNAFQNINEAKTYLTEYVQQDLDNKLNELNYEKEYLEKKLLFFNNLEKVEQAKNFMANNLSIEKITFDKNWHDITKNNPKLVEEANEYIAEQKPLRQLMYPTNSYKRTECYCKELHTNFNKALAHDEYTIHPQRQVYEYLIENEGYGPFLDEAIKNATTQEDIKNLTDVKNFLQDCFDLKNIIKESHKNILHAKNDEEKEHYIALKKKCSNHLKDLMKSDISYNIDNIINRTLAGKTMLGLIDIASKEYNKKDKLLKKSYESDIKNLVTKRLNNLTKEKDRYIHHRDINNYQSCLDSFPAMKDDPKLKLDRENWEIVAEEIHNNNVLKMLNSIKNS